MRLLIALLAVLSFGLATFWMGTDGLRAFTAESARRLAVKQRPQPIPNVLLEDQWGQHFPLQQLRGKLVLAEFIYTRCQSICLALGNSFQQIQRRLRAVQPKEPVLLLSISFDPADQGADLAALARRFQQTGDDWLFARVVNPDQLPALLDVFGIVVVPKPDGEFDHNAAIHLIDTQGRLSAILDYETPEAVMELLDV